MAREIDILYRASGKACAIVEKTSHVLWSRDELREALWAGCYPDEDRLAPPSPHTPISSPYPGCMQQAARPADLERFHLVGQTEHFLVFAPLRDSPSMASPGSSSPAAVACP